MEKNTHKTQKVSYRSNRYCYINTMLGVIVQLLINDTLFGWDPVGNIKNAGSAFIGVIAFVLLYILFIRKTRLVSF